MENYNSAATAVSTVTNAPICILKMFSALPLNITKKIEHGPWGLCRGKKVSQVCMPKEGAKPGNAYQV
jgi:hypothetical protein